MKLFFRFFITSLLFLFILCSCTEPTASAGDEELLTYSIAGSSTTLKADVTYMDENNGIIKLSDQALPWTVTLDLSGSTFTGEAYLKAEIPESEVFIAFTSGTADAVPESRKLNDSAADFVSTGVLADDVIYIDPSTLEYSEVVAVDDSDTLSLKSDMFTAGNENYFVYHKKNITATVDYNGTIEEEVTSESERILSALVLTPIAR